MSTSDLVEQLHRKIVENFMDILILSEMNNKTVSGYDVIHIVRRKFGILLSSGTVYSLIYSLERDGLIKGTQSSRKRIYSLTHKGSETIAAIMEAKKETQRFVGTLY